MSKLDLALSEMCQLEKEASGGNDLCIRSPLVKLFLTVWYLGWTVSFSPYDLTGLMAMAIYPLSVFILVELSWTKLWKRIKIAIPFVLFIGLLNPLFSPNLQMGLTSMVSLWMKGLFTIMAVYLLVVSTTIEQLCMALRRIHVPTVMVTVILLIYRYLYVLIKEFKRLWEGYTLMAPGQKGIAFRAWGPFLGQLLLRSMDRAALVYDSMNLRGYEWSMSDAGLKQEAGEKIVNTGDILYLLFWTVIIVVLRLVPVFALVGNMFA